MFQPLKDIRIIDLTQVLAGPYATYQLALLGADVIKVEPPTTGDWTREGTSPKGLENQNMGTAYLTQNANKKSITLDLKNEADIQTLHDLIKTADIFVENFRPGTAKRLGLSYKDIKKINSNIIYCSISAYGQDGPIGNRPAYDHIVQGMCGIMRTTGTAITEPNKVGAPYIDYATGLNGAFAIVSALLEVKRTGKGIQLDVAMLDTSILLMSSLVTNHLNNGWKPVASGNEAWSQSPSSGTFETKAGMLLIAANNERQFKNLCTALELQDLLEDVRFKTLEKRNNNKNELRRLIEQRVIMETADYWENKLNSHAVPSTRVRSLDEVLSEPQIKKRKITGKLKVPGATKEIHMPALGFKANGQAITPRSPPPRLGEHNSNVLTKNRQSTFSD
ncbi:MAG: CoA transferase [Rhodospirillaceae bacterium]|nr:CoA transferase [Rhodospirillaceae bacterium]|tara:strand:+ start:323 stop:1498 length:1176 start_codon:yes stop_codon:yes gene_type:complete